jgi:hypothetical protein
VKRCCLAKVACPTSRREDGRWLNRKQDLVTWQIANRVLASLEILCLGRAGIRIRSCVVFPAPVGHSKASTWPRSTARLTPASASVDLKRFATASTSIAVSAITSRTGRDHFGRADPKDRLRPVGGAGRVTVLQPLMSYNGLRHTDQCAEREMTWQLRAQYSHRIAYWDWPQSSGCA